MNRHIHSFLSPSIASIFLLFSSNLYACDPCDPSTRKPTKADYNELCSIYKNITRKHSNLSTNTDIKENELMFIVNRELPVLFNELYIVYMGTNSRVRYSYIQEYAKLANKITWECEAAKQYYINDLKKDS
ncbi:hypothetical protein MNBD_GAMMA10-514 [hydrothermal vent metagenome]|uniref:Uncharacterized protein n=1 Tax=hydrothermal vent metagenome TaxID=652676 RepID=A0A3B0Y1B6_9ZZZZ